MGGRFRSVTQKKKNKKKNPEKKLLRNKFRNLN